MVTKHLVIQGRVQGVGYRYSFEIKARALQVTGWVRNNRNGDVEAVVHGSSENIQSLIDWAYEGPSMADVKNILISDINGEFDQFEIRPTQ